MRAIKVQYMEAFTQHIRQKNRLQKKICLFCVYHNKILKDIECTSASRELRFTMRYLVVAFFSTCFFFFSHVLSSSSWPKNRNVLICNKHFHCWLVFNTDKGIRSLMPFCTTFFLWNDWCANVINFDCLN